MARITYTESTPDQAQAAEILIPAIVVEAGSIVIPQGANVVSTDDDGAVTHNWKAQKVTSS
jgi:hypothetical protein